MEAGITDHVWEMQDLLNTTAVQEKAAA